VDDNEKFGTVSKEGRRRQVPCKKEKVKSERGWEYLLLYSGGRGDSKWKKKSLERMEKKRRVQLKKQGSKARVKG